MKRLLLSLLAMAACLLPCSAGNPEYVDLGLSVKWGTCNLGANKPENLGDYYAWGETSPKREYSWGTYKYCNGDEYHLTKYNFSSTYGVEDKKDKLEPEDDAAHIKLGGKWRMPSNNEWIELIQNCDWVWTTVEGCEGYKISSKLEGYKDRYIFLPAAGFCRKSTIQGQGSDAGYWSSTCKLTGREAIAASFSSRNVSRDACFRFIGFSIRPVYDEPTSIKKSSSYSVEFESQSPLDVMTPEELEMVKDSLRKLFPNLFKK